MTEEAEKAAKWEIVEQYQKAKEKLAVLETRCHETGGMISQFGSAIANVPTAVTITKLEVSIPKYVHEPKKTERVAFPLSILDMETIKTLVDDYQETLQVKTATLSKLREMKIDLEPRF